jgi:hypothetical protein
MGIDRHIVATSSLQLFFNFHKKFRLRIFFTDQVTTNNFFVNWIIIKLGIIKKNVMMEIHF